MNFLDENRPLVLDGGMATELERSHQKDLSSHLWSASILRDDPQSIKDVHLAYYHAGAHVATTASYQASISGFVKFGCTVEEAEMLMRRSVQIAVDARKEYLERDASIERSQSQDLNLLIALSIGPYGAVLANGSEYSGIYPEITINDLVEFHRSRLRIFMQEPGVDIIAFETIPSLEEARAICEVLRTENISIPSWVSFSCRDEHCISSGELLADCVDVFQDVDSVIALGVNCTKPWLISSLLHDLNERNQRQNLPKYLISYADGGKVWDLESRGWMPGSSTDILTFSNYIHEWINIANRRIIIGGCCGSTPEHITAVASVVNSYS